MQNAGFHTLLNCLKCIIYEDCYNTFKLPLIPSRNRWQLLSEGFLSWNIVYMSPPGWKHSRSVLLRTE